MGRAAWKQAGHGHTRPHGSMRAMGHTRPYGRTRAVGSRVRGTRPDISTDFGHSNRDEPDVIMTKIREM